MKSSKRIIFPVEFIFTDRDFSRFGVDLLTSRGFIVEIWLLSPLLNPAYYFANQYSSTSNLISMNLISSKQQVFSLLSKLTLDDVVMSISSISPQNYFLYREINIKKIPLGFFQGAYLPQLEPQKNITKIVINNLNFKLINKIYRKIKSLITYHIYQKIEADFVVSIGVKHFNQIPNIFNISDKFNLIKSHSFDFDTFIKNEKNEKINLFDSKYILFLDEAVTHHPDHEHSGIDTFCNEKLYFTELNNFFDFLEHETGFKVVVAAHPKSNYGSVKDFFNGRKIIYGQTIELVSNAQLVLLHASNSVNFAILYNKPVMYLTSLSYEDEFRRKISLRADTLSLTPVKLPLDENISINYSVDHSKYEYYLSNYIKYPGSDNKLFWNTVADYLDQ